MIEGSELLCRWVNSRHNILFAVVAVVTGEGQIIEGIASRIGDGLDVIYCKRIERERFRRTAVLAPMVRPFHDLPAYGKGDFASCWHGGLGGGDGVNPQLLHKLPNGNPAPVSQLCQVLQSLGTPLFAFIQDGLQLRLFGF